MSPRESTRKDLCCVFQVIPLTFFLAFSHQLTLPLWLSLQVITLSTGSPPPAVSHEGPGVPEPLGHFLPTLDPGDWGGSTHHPQVLSPRAAPVHPLEMPAPVNSPVLSSSHSFMIGPNNVHSCCILSFPQLR